MVALVDFAKYVRPEVPECPEPILMDAIRRACITVCEKIEAVTELVSFPTVSDVDTYVLNVSTDFRPHRIKRVLLNGGLLRGVVSFVFSTYTPSFGTPVLYVSDVPGQLKLWPSPDKVYSINVTVVVTPSDIADFVPDVLYTEWKDIVAAFAKSYLMSMVGHPWSNAEAALVYKTEGGRLLTLARIAANKGFVGAPLSVVARPVV